MRGSTAGIEDNLLKGRSTPYYYLLTCLDILFANFVVTPCVVGYWRSVWNLMDFYVTPDRPTVSAFISTGIGIVGHLVFTLGQKFFSDCFNPEKNRLIFYIVSRTYTVCFAFTCVNGWRGPWLLLTNFTDSRATVIYTTILVGIVALVAIRALRNLLSPPFSVVMDSAKEYFDVVTMFRISVTESTTLYILDCLFSVLVVGALVVFVWRGAWVLVDFYMFPDDPVLSAWGSLILGYLVVAVAFMLQPTMRYVCDKLTGGARLIAADIYILYSLVGTINVWRGIWNLLDIYFLPENPQLSCWITHWVCLILLILLGCSNSLLVRGVYVDAEEPAGKCVVFPCYYLRIIFQEERLKKLNKLQLNDNNQIRKSTTNNPSADKTTVDNNHHIVTVTNTIYNHKEIS